MQKARIRWGVLALFLLLFLSACRKEAPALQRQEAVDDWNETAALYNETAALAEENGWGGEETVYAHFGDYLERIGDCRRAILTAGSGEELLTERERLETLREEINSTRGEVSVPRFEPMEELATTTRKAAALYEELSVLIRQNEWDRDPETCRRMEESAQLINRAAESLETGEEASVSGELLPVLRDFLSQGDSLREQFGGPFRPEEGGLVVTVE